MKAIIGVSNRHVHLTEEDYKILFGDLPLEVVKYIDQPGQFSSTQKVSIKTEKNTINNVRVLGPLRPYTQAEVSKTDCFVLGIKAPIRTSGDLEGAAELTIVGPMGEITKPCAIIANRHLHITPAERIQYNLVGVEKVKVRIGSEKATVFEDVYVKESENAALAIHLDTDDGNGSLAVTGEEAEIIF